MALSDRMAVMRDGRLAQVGAPAAIYDAPADRFTAGFIGEVNLVPATRLGDGRFSVQGLDAPVAVAAAPSAADGEASLAVRPERLTLTAGAPGAGLPGWRVVVRERTLLGPAVSFTLAEASGLILQALTPSSDPAAAMTPDDSAFACFRPDDASVVGD